MLKILKKLKNKELRGFVSFFLTAILGAGTNFITQIPYKYLFLHLGFADKPAFNFSVSAGYLTATVVSFVPAKVFAFSARESGNTRRESVKFLTIALLAWGIQVGVSSLAFDHLANRYFAEQSLLVREKSSHVVGMGVSFLANYFGHKFLTFRSTGIYNRIKTRNGRQN